MISFGLNANVWFKRYSILGPRQFTKQIKKIFFHKEKPNFDYKPISYIRRMSSVISKPKNTFLYRIIKDQVEIFMKREYRKMIFGAEDKKFPDKI